MTGPIPDDHVLDMSEPLPRYLLELSDGNLDLVDRSQCGIIVMYAGVALQALSYRQHSIALDAHASECFSASGGAAVVMLTKERLQSLGYEQPFPTPCYSSDSDVQHAQGGKRRGSAQALGLGCYLRRRISFMMQAVHECWPSSACQARSTRPTR